MSSFQPPPFTNDDGMTTTSGTLTPTSTIDGSLAEAHSSARLYTDLQRELAEINREIATIRRTCDNALRQCEMLEEAARRLADSWSAASSGTLTSFGKLLPPIGTSVNSLRASPAWVQHGLPREGYQTEAGIPIVSRAVWEEIKYLSRERSERMVSCRWLAVWLEELADIHVRDMITEVLDETNSDPGTLQGRTKLILMTIAISRALSELHPVRKSSGGVGSFWQFPVQDLDKRLREVYTAWEDLSGHLSTLRSHGIGSSKVYVKQLVKLRAFPGVSLAPTTSDEITSTAIRGSLIAAESLTNLLADVASELSGQEEAFSKPGTS